jgi:Zn-finger nucleic acid-binding protein
MELTCPKCHGTMRTYERNGVHVDQCSDCRGIFLDRGELERLVDAEIAWHDRPSEGRGTTAQTAHGTAGHTPSAGAGLGAGGLGAVVGEVLNQVQGKKHGSSYGHGGKRKQSFLGDLFG